MDYSSHVQREFLAICLFAGVSGCVASIDDASGDHESLSTAISVPAPTMDADACIALRRSYNQGQRRVGPDLSVCYQAAWRRLFQSLSPTEFSRTSRGERKPDQTVAAAFLDDHALLVPWNEHGEPHAGKAHALRVMQYDFEQPADELKLRSFLQEEEDYFGPRGAGQPGKGYDFERMVDALMVTGRTTKRMQFLLNEWAADFEDEETGENAHLDAWECFDPALNCWKFAAYSSRVLQHGGVAAQRLEHDAHSWTGIRFRNTNLHIDLEAHQFTGLQLLSIMSQNVLQAAPLNDADAWRHGFGFFPRELSYFGSQDHFFDGKACPQLHDEDARRLLPSRVPLTRPQQRCSSEGPGEITPFNPMQWSILETNAMTFEAPAGGDQYVLDMLPVTLAAKLVDRPHCTDTAEKRAVMRGWLTDYFGAMDQFEKYFGRPACEPSRVSEALRYGGLE